MKNTGKILVATDFSEAANNATVYAVQLAEQIEQDIIIMYAHSEDEEDGSIQDRFEKLEHDYLYGRNVSCTFDTRTGGVVDSIREVIDEYDIDFMVVGTRGFEGLKEMEIGSLTAMLLDDPVIPVISIPKYCKKLNFRKVALACDFSGDDHKDALNLVNQLAKQLKSDIRIIHIRSQEEEDVPKEVKKQYEKIFSLVPHSYCEIMGENVVNGILDYCNKEDVDVLITLREKHKDLEKTLSGSISKSLSLRGQVPLMVVPVFYN